MDIITWNVQACLGVDGREDLARICGVVRRMGGADVICLQEVAQHLLAEDGSVGADQVAALAREFPGHETFFGAAIDLAGASGRRQRFGNLVLSRLPVAQCFMHPLPQPPEPGVLHMPRQATEVVVETDGGALRITTTHLEFHSAAQRQSQVRRLLDIHDEICAGARRPPLYAEHGPYAKLPRPPSAVLCGDFNFTVSDDAYQTIIGGSADEALRLVDAWPSVHGAREHAPTCGIFDREQWPQGAHCRDFFFVTEDIAARVEDVLVDVDTDASDHQPMRLRLG
ncbi:MAG: endonuclease/exonuclease/phosphatase family protein [Gammaproteobacteria bacterium]|nr:endonuclease/exonuclease/phosphatase family protein [Gammaproteobacteria bacterium]